jgi:alanyl-tRNA synthetase
VTPSPERSTTIPAYERDPRQRTLTTRVLARNERDGAPVLVLEDTILYPEGGGQPSDLGTIDGVPVTDVRRVDGRIEHTVAVPVEADEVTVRLDWERRFDHMQQHTAQHLLTAIAADRFGWQTTAFHLGERLCDIELDVPELGPDELIRLEEAVADEIRAARPVTARRVPLDAYADLDVRSRGLPAGHVGDVRLVEIEGIDLNTCGGTHCASTAELEALKLLGTESMRGGTRLFFLAGARLRARLGAAHARAAELRAILGASDDELVDAVQSRVEQARESGKAVRRLEEELAEALADSLAARDETVIVEHWSDRGLPFLQKLARAVNERAPERVLLLTAGTGTDAVFVLAAGREAHVDVRALGSSVAEILDGKGGGSGAIFQGRAGALSGLGAAEALVRAAAG